MYMTPKDASRYLKISVSRLAAMRMERIGPPFSKCGRSVLYTVADLDAWVKARKVATAA